MPAFAFLAVDPNGRRIRGIEEAASDAALAHGLEARGLLVVEVAERADAEQRSGFGGGQRQAVLEVTRAVAALLTAGLPLARALGAAAHVATGDAAAATQTVRSRVERGESLASALAAYPALFSPLYVGLVRAGERSGDLAGAFTRLADQLERDERLRARLLSLSVYPMILAAAALDRPGPRHRRRPETRLAAPGRARGRRAAAHRLDAPHARRPPRRGPHPARAAGHQQPAPSGARRARRAS